MKPQGLPVCCLNNAFCLDNSLITQSMRKLFFITIETHLPQYNVVINPIYVDILSKAESHFAPHREFKMLIWLQTPSLVSENWYLCTRELFLVNRLAHHVKESRWEGQRNKKDGILGKNAFFFDSCEEPDIVSVQ